MTEPDDAFVADVITEAAWCQARGFSTDRGVAGLAERVCKALAINPLRRTEVSRIIEAHQEEIRTETEHLRSRVSARGGRGRLSTGAGAGLSTGYPQPISEARTRRERIREVRESIEIRAWYCLSLAVGQLRESLETGDLTVRDRVSIAHFFRELAMEQWSSPAAMLREIRIVACDVLGNPIKMPGPDDPIPELPGPDEEKSSDGLVISPDEETDR